MTTLLPTLIKYFSYFYFVFIVPTGTEIAVWFVEYPLFGIHNSVFGRLWLSWEVVGGVGERAWFGFNAG